ncbi:MAG: hypothetical protein WA006_00790 [Rhodoglobus sp.]
MREVEGGGTARERWWERVPGGISLTPEGAAQSDAVDFIRPDVERYRGPRRTCRWSGLP